MNDVFSRLFIFQYSFKVCHNPTTWQFLTILLIIRVIITFEDDRFLLITLDFALLNQFLFFGSYAFKKNRSRFIIRVLWNEFSSNCKVKNFGFDTLYGICQTTVGNIKIIYTDKSILYGFYNSFLFFYWRNRNNHCT